MAAPSFNSRPARNGVGVITGRALNWHGYGRLFEQANLPAARRQMQGAGKGIVASADKDGVVSFGHFLTPSDVGIFANAFNSV